MYFKFCGWSRSFIITTLPLILALLAAQPAGAALLNVTQSWPDIQTLNSNLAYDYTGTGGTLTVNGTSTQNGGGTSSQLISFTSVDPALQLWNTPGPAPTTNPNLTLYKFTHYDLAASFDANGNFIGGTVSISDAYLSDEDLASAPAGWVNSGTVLTGNLTDFGFYGSQNGSMDNLTLNFLYDVTGGDLSSLGYTWGGIELHTNVQTALSGGMSPLQAANIAYGMSATNWDGLTTATQQLAFMQDFYKCTSGCTQTLDTFVPLPGAVWLFGSGLIGLFAFTRRRVTS
jgi:hypothetical protein